MSRRRAGREPNWGAGLAIGVGIGTALSVALENWAFLPIGLALGAALPWGLAAPAGGERE